MHCYLFDIDGTLADLTHRLHHISGEFDDHGMTKPKDWNSFFDACGDDAPICHMIDLCRTLATHASVIFVSGRSDRTRHVTQKWLAVNGLFGDIYMRKDGDHRPDHIVKAELLDKIVADGKRPIMAFDDRDQVVKMWRARGIPCAQVADGNF